MACIERGHLTMRTFSSRLTRKGIAFSKNIDMHKASAALEDIYYNLIKPLKTLRLSWLKQSPSLQGLSVQQAPYQRSRLAPQWFSSRASGLKKIYAVPAHENHNWGNVIIDEATGTVYVCIVWS